MPGFLHRPIGNPAIRKVAEVDYYGVVRAMSEGETDHYMLGTGRISRSMASALTTRIHVITVQLYD
jgi:hypothetical protein